MGSVPGVTAPELGVQLGGPKPSSGLGAASGSGVRLVLGQSGAEDPSSSRLRQLRRSLWALATGSGVSPAPSLPCRRAPLGARLALQLIASL